MSGIELLQRLRDDDSQIEVIILTGQGTIETAVQAMKLGANDFLTKPCPLSDLDHHCQLAYERGRLRKENRQLREIISRTQESGTIIGESPAMQSVVKMVQRIAPTDQPVLLTGESGTGKEVVARAVQSGSLLADRPFVTINCAALPEQLVESELFGHQKGAFTGATNDKPGLFEVADGGTLFIDELGELPRSLQPKLLRVLEDGSMRRIGSSKERRVRVRLIAATNRDLGKQVADGTFREDLYYRVNVLPIHLPPLRDRPGDVEQLVRHFMPAGWRIDAEALLAMVNHPWPGNVRELINAIQRATILADNNEITLDDLPRELAHPSGDSHVDPISSASPQVVDGHGTGENGHPARPPGAASSGDRLDDIARTHVMTVLEREGGNKARTARKLGIHRRKLYRLLERFEADAAARRNSDSEPETS